MNLRRVTLAFSLVILPLFNLDCSSTQKQVESQIAVKVADDVCQAALDQTGVDPEWIKLVCEAGSGLIPVIMPKTEWYAVKARTTRDGGLPDAGPGMRTATPAGDVKR